MLSRYLAGQHTLRRRSAAAPLLIAGTFVSRAVAPWFGLLFQRGEFFSVATQPTVLAHKQTIPQNGH